jgi:sigma-B regulation protein RsbU (phosphoserine phosphatase)
MGIRYKLLALLLFISLAPLLFVGGEVRNNLETLGNGLVARSSNSLMNNARGSLKRIVEDHARILRRESQLLESNTQFLASKIEGILYGHEHLARDHGAAPSPAQLEAAREDYYFLHRHGRQSLQVDFDSLEIGNDTAQVPEPTSKFLNELLMPVLRNIKFRYPRLVLWIDVRLSDHTKITYPQSISHVFMRRPLYEDVDTGHVRELVWSHPQTDPRTQLLAFNVTVPIRDDEGLVQGDVTIVVPVSALLHRSPHLSIFSERSVSLLVNPETAPDTDETRLKVIAREQTAQFIRDHWGRPDRETWLLSEDAGSYTRMMEMLQSSTSGTTDMPHDGEDTLWAYAPIEPGSAALMILVPKADVIRETSSVREFILSQIRNHTSEMGYIVFMVAAAVFGVALVLSAFFTRKISRLAAAVGLIAEGNFSARADIRGNDEIGRLGQAFNRMVPELEDRIHLKNALEVAQQVQQNLLPTGSPQFLGYDIAAVSEYCYETGGDYYGFIPRRNEHGASLVIAVGDVSGHGIPAALMMASARAYIRSHAACGATLDEVATRANALIADDTDRTGRFMTLFLLELTKEGAVRWVRAGHDPALVYLPAEDRFEELVGQGLPLGVLHGTKYELNERRDLPAGSVVIIGTDGIWEATAADGRMFGKERFRDILRRHGNEPAAAMIDAVLRELGEFRGDMKKADDMTIAVIRIP